MVFDDQLRPYRDIDYDQTPPIIIMSFNRPQYLVRVLSSIKTQTPEIDQRRIHLFQDGAVNAYSRVEYAKQEDISTCIAVFRKMFPRGEVHHSRDNIGICENFLRAERFAFVTLDAPIAYFFEDDLVLSPKYVATLEILRRDFKEEPRIGYFNAVGSFNSSLAVQEENKNNIMKMDHLWGFALTQLHWNNMQPLLSAYYGLVCGQDYRRRPNDKIQSLFRKWKIRKPATSQDSAKDIVTLLLGAWRASSFICLAQYIGELGTHSTPDKFANRGFSKTQIYQNKIPPEFLIKPEQIELGISHLKKTWSIDQDITE